jgi:hypothetical protein
LTGVWLRNTWQRWSRKVDSECNSSTGFVL